MMERAGYFRPFGSCCALLWFAALSFSAGATTFARLSLAQMSQTATAIVRAQCAANTVVWDSGEIWTLTTFDVRETWRGAVPLRITVRLLGGTAGNLTSSVSGIPRFRPGENVVLFLEPTARGDFSIVSWQRGTFRIRGSRDTGEELVTQDGSAYAAFDPVSRRFTANGVVQMPLASFRSQVIAALDRGASREP